MGFKFHALRHFCATNLLSEGASIAAVAGHLGDTIEAVQKVYAHWSRDDLDVPVDILNRLWSTVMAEATPLAPASSS
jgi:integrase